VEEYDVEFYMVPETKLFNFLVNFNKMENKYYKFQSRWISLKLQINYICFTALFSLFISIENLTHAQAPGNTCAAAVTLTSPAIGSFIETGVQSTCGRGNNIAAGFSSVNTSYGGGEDAYYSLTVPAGGGNYTFAFFGGGATWKILSIHSACAPAVANTVGGFATGSLSNGTTTLNLNAGTYRLVIDTWPTPNCGSFNLRITRNAPAVPPANDACANATPLPCGTSGLAGTTVNSVVETAPSGCASQRGVWYTFTGDGQQTTLTSPTTFDHELTIVSGSCGSFTNIACVDGNTGTETYTFTTTIGVQYYVYVAHWSASSTTTGTFSISRSCIIPCSTSPSTLTANLSATVVNDAVTYTTSGGSGTVTGYEFSSNNFSTVAGSFATTASPWTLLLNVLEPQLYVRAITQASGCATVFSNAVMVSLSCATPITDGTSDGDYITNVSFNSINNNSTSEAFADAYQNFTSISTSVCKGSSYPLSVSGTSTFGSNQGFSAWIDWNGDGVFQTTEQVLTSAPAPSASSSVTVPLTAVAGTVKMRVASRWNGTPNANACDPTPYGFGEMEEYSILINNPSSPPTSISNTGIYCHGNQVTLSVNGGSLASGSNWEWFTTSCGGTPAGSSPSITVSPNNTTQYFVRAAATSVCPASACANGTITLPTAGANISTSGESATCVVSGPNWVRFYAPSGNLILAINPNNQNLGNVQVTSYVDGGGTMHACGNSGNALYETAYLGRNWLIFAENQPTSPVSVQYPFADGELSALVTSSANTTSNLTDDVLSRTDLVLTKYTATDPATEDSSPLNNCTGGVTRILPLAGSGMNPYGLANVQFVTFSLNEFSENYLHGSTGPSALPVDLVSFSASCESEGVKLSWITASETNSKQFTIERSRDLVTWLEVGVIQAAGSTSQATNYEYIDAYGAGLNYYRLRQIDFDGNQHILPEIYSNCDVNDYKVEVFPNPTNGEFTLAIYSTELYADAEITILDVAGKLISSQKVSIQIGRTDVHHQITDLKAGTYVIQVKTDTRIFKSIRFVKVD
jgi:hypothetical protein